MGMFDNFNLQRGLAGASGGAQGIQAYDARQAQGLQQQQQAQQLQRQQGLDDLKRREEDLIETARYVRTLPPDQRTMGATEYLRAVKGWEDQHLQALQPVLSDMSDQKLDGVINAQYGRTTVKANEAVLGSDGKPIYENRPNQVVADGSTLVGGQGQALYENQKDAPQVKPTADIQNYQFARQNGFNGSLMDYQTQLKQAGRPTTSVTVEAAKSLMPGQKKVDEAYADDYITWRQGGGADSVKMIDQLDIALDTLNSGESLTGPVIGLTPDAIKAFTNPKSIEVRDQIAEVVQRNLRLILGAQFTEKEGKMLMDRAFNPALGEEENARRVQALIKQIKTAADSKESAAQYFEENGTLRGWGGKQYSMQDFEAAIEGQQPESLMAGPNQSSIPTSAADYLRQNPNLATQFDEKYGQGASQRILGGG